MAENIKRTIGGFLEMEHFGGSEYYVPALRFNLSRSAIVYAMRTLGYSKLFIPYYICDCIPNSLRANGLDYDYYHIDVDFRPVTEKPLSKNEAVLVVNYFGMLDDEQIDIYNKEFDNRMIVDNTQAFYSDNRRGGSVYTCRKWFGVADGAYLLNVDRTDEYNRFGEDMSADRISHLAKKFENRESELYRRYSEIEESFEHSGILKMSRVTQNLLKAVNYEKVAEKRKRNWDALHGFLSGKSEFEIKSLSVPFMYALYTEKAPEIRNTLKSYRIFLPLLWPNCLDYDESWLEYKLARNLLCLPVDQRYDESDMEYLGETVLKALK